MEFCEQGWGVVHNYHILTAKLQVITRWQQNSSRHLVVSIGL